MQLISDDDHDAIERFVILLYGRASICTSVNQCRRELFSKKSRMVENIFPTFDTLQLHIKRAKLQSRWVNKFSPIRSNAYQVFRCYMFVSAELIGWNVAVAKSKIWNVLSYVDAAEKAARKWSDMLSILLWKWFYKNITHNSYSFCYISFILVRVFRNV